MLAAEPRSVLIAGYYLTLHQTVDLCASLNQRYTGRRKGRGLGTLTVMT
jgi:hypothetical protein